MARDAGAVQAGATACLGCGAAAVETLVAFGAQPPSNRFVGGAIDDAQRHPLTLGQCAGCALVQLVDPMPVQMVRSRYEWLAYNEPEGHLDTLVEQLAGLPRITRESRIIGLTYKDDSTLARLNRRGFARTLRFDPRADLGLEDPHAGLESIQGVLDEALAGRLAAKHGHADLLIVRHVIEHAHAPERFLRAAKTLLAEGGYLVFEMPDCVKFLHACDYSFVWEEHITYFSADTLRSFAARHGLRDAAMLSYPYPLEDSLVAVLERGVPQGARPAPDARALQVGRDYGASFGRIRSQLREHLASLRACGTRIAVFGAGHLAAKYLNLFGLADYVECVIDDNPHKQGLLMPGSRLPIVGSAALVERSIGLCLLSLSPESEQKVLARRQDYLDRGGRFASIFALSPLALRPR